MTLGDRIKSLREKKGMTQLELAEKLGYKSKSSVAHIENGRDIPRAMVVTLADILDTTPAYLMGWEDEPTNLNFNTTPTEDIKDMTPEQIKKALEDLKDFAEKNYPELAESFMKNTTPNADILFAGENKPAARQLTDRQEKIVDLFDVLTEPQQDNIIGRAETFAEQNEKDFQRQESV